MKHVPIVGILKIGNMDFDKGKVKVSKAVINNVTSSLSANINEAAVDNLITSKGYDEIDYVISLVRQAIEKQFGNEES